MASFNTSWPSPSNVLDALSNDGLPMDMIPDMQEAFEPLTRARYVVIKIEIWLTSCVYLYPAVCCN